MFNPALLTSRSREWSTPREFFETLDRQFHFTLDPCATRHNAKCKRYFTKADDGLSQRWNGRVFVNPPYGREIGKWVKKAYEESLTSAELVACLLPARTDTKWWHEYAMRGEVSFIKGRLQFSGAKSGAPFPSAVVIFRRRSRRRLLRNSCNHALFTKNEKKICHSNGERSVLFSYHGKE
jgi:phage N-6-adenine-methyltransferase